MLLNSAYYKFGGEKEGISFKERIEIQQFSEESRFPRTNTVYPMNKLKFTLLQLLGPIQPKRLVVPLRILAIPPLISLKL